MRDIIVCILKNSHLCGISECTDENRGAKQNAAGNQVINGEKYIQAHDEKSCTAYEKRIGIAFGEGAVQFVFRSFSRNFSADERVGDFVVAAKKFKDFRTLQCGS